MPSFRDLLRHLFVAPLAAVFVSGAAVAAPVDIVDDQGQALRLAQPARRIVSLAPHITELLYAAGAGERMVGTVEYSDYPEAAKKLPRVGGYVRVNLEAIVGLKPDLVVAWKSGNSAAHIEKLRGLGISTDEQSSPEVHLSVWNGERPSKVRGSTRRVIGQR